mmetsp:Transcript_13844/g.28377  ORF Transcript_13844/g.28377 Transcript_13844/m.28377 type:complete len:210 (+) Transcript_13844:590-1219(+)
MRQKCGREGASPSAFCRHFRVHAARHALEAHGGAEVEEQRARLGRAVALLFAAVAVNDEVGDVVDVGVVRVPLGRTTHLGKRLPRDTVQRLNRLVLPLQLPLTSSLHSPLSFLSSFPWFFFTILLKPFVIAVRWRPRRWWDSLPTRKYDSAARSPAVGSGAARPAGSQARAAYASQLFAAASTFLLRAVLQIFPRRLPSSHTSSPALEW